MVAVRVTGVGLREVLGMAVVKVVVRVGERAVGRVGEVMVMLVEAWEVGVGATVGVVPGVGWVREVTGGRVREEGRERVVAVGVGTVGTAGRSCTE